MLKNEPQHSNLQCLFYLWFQTESPLTPHRKTSRKGPTIVPCGTTRPGRPAHSSDTRRPTRKFLGRLFQRRHRRVARENANRQRVTPVRYVKRAPYVPRVTGRTWSEGRQAGVGRSGLSPRWEQQVECRVRHLCTVLITIPARTFIISGPGGERERRIGPGTWRRPLGISFSSRLL